MTETRSVLITGCSSGIGLDAAVTLRARGWRVLATCRQQADVDRLSAEGLECHRLDYADEPSIEAAMGAILDTTDGRLDAVFHNGAFAIPGFIEDLPTAALREQFEANFFGWHTLTRLVLPVMRRQGHGRIVLCSSVLGFVGARYRGAYVASKHALEGWADCLRLECRDLPIHVSLIQPGPIETRFNANALARYRRWIDLSASPRAAELATIERRYTAERRPSVFEQRPPAVTKRVVHALESGRPRRRYRVTTPTHVAALMRRAAPTAWLDWLMARN